MKMPDSVGKSNWKHKLSIANLEQLLLLDNFEGKSVFQPETSLVHPYLIIQHTVTNLPQTWMNCQFDKWFQLFKQLSLSLNVSLSHCWVEHLTHHWAPAETLARTVVACRAGHFVI